MPRTRMSLLWWGWIPATLLAWWVLQRALFPGMTWSQWFTVHLTRWLFPAGADLGHATALFWIMIVIGFIGQAVIITSPEGGDSKSGHRDATTGALFIGSIGTALAALLFTVIPALWNNDKSEGQYFNHATVVNVDAGARPSSLTYLYQGGNRGKTARCDYRGSHDVDSCVKTTPGLPAIASWEGRTSSYASARHMLGQTASPAPRVDAWDASLTYLYGPTKDAGKWAVILDGSGKATPLYGIGEWDGKANQVKVACRFNIGDGNRAKRAFHGSRKNSLRNLLADKYRGLLYDDEDVWGYCKDGKPQVIVPVVKQTAVGHRTVPTAAGILVITGGGRDVHIEHRSNVAPGALPGPVYPLTLAKAQRDQVDWAAGRKWKQRGGFGYRTTDDTVQGDNSGEYLLRAADGRLRYVTPLTPNASRGQAFVAYSVVAADTVTSGRFNQATIAVLPDGDARVANLNTLTNAATDAVRQRDPSFLNTGGKLEEFTPLGGDMWRVYGVRRGQTEFYVDLSSTNRVEPRTVNVTGSLPEQPGQSTVNPTGGAQSASGACGKPPARQTRRELLDCLQGVSSELQRR